MQIRGSHQIMKQLLQDEAQARPAFLQNHPLPKTQAPHPEGQPSY